MSERAARAMSQDEFLDWCQFQDVSYELVDGAPVAMVGASRAHDRVVVNALRVLGNQLDGKPCQPFTDDCAVRIPNGNTRRPDVGVDCGPFDPDALAVKSPRLVLEVLSPSTRTFDMFDKLDEYKTVAGLAHIILVDPDAPQVMHWWRDTEQTWLHARHDGLEATIVIPDLEVRLGMRDLYAGMTFRPRPRLWNGASQTTDQPDDI
jgi:Uma2 family endonuclease